MFPGCNPVSTTQAQFITFDKMVVASPWSVSLAFCLPRAPLFLHPGLFQECCSRGFPPSFPSHHSHPQVIIGKPPAWIHKEEEIMRLLWKMEREKNKTKKLTKLHKMVRVFYLYSLLKPTEASDFKTPHYGLTAVRSLPLTCSRWFPGERVGPWLFGKICPRSSLSFLLFSLTSFFFFFFEHCMNGLPTVCVTYVNKDNYSIIYETLKWYKRNIVISLTFTNSWPLPSSFIFLTLKSSCKTGIHADYSPNKQWRRKWHRVTLLLEWFGAFPLPEFSKPLKKGGFHSLGEPEERRQKFIWPDIGLAFNSKHIKRILRRHLQEKIRARWEIRDVLPVRLFASEWGYGAESGQGRKFRSQWAFFKAMSHGP